MQHKWYTQYGHCMFKKNGRTEKEVDCWQLLRLVYRDHLGIDLPAIEGVYIDDNPMTLRKVSRIMRDHRKRWINITDPKDFDVVLLKPRGNMFFHVGCYIHRNKMLHIEEGSQVTAERIDGIMWQNRIEGFYRHANLC